MSTGWVWDERYMWHDTGHAAAFLTAGGVLEPDEHVERPATKRRLRNLLEVSGMLDQLTPLKAREATAEELMRVHSSAHVEHVQEVSNSGGGMAGDQTPIGPGGYEIVALAAGGAIAAIDAVLSGEVNNAYALIRPPGHHSGIDQSLGFCVFNNVAVAAEHARVVHGLKRVAIIDWDAHHGNGTQEIFWDQPGVLTISIHQDGCYPPQSGLVDECGSEQALATNINIPLPPGSGVGAYQASVEQIVVPALNAFRPEMVIVACGFDASPMDPLARMMVHSGGFAAMTASVMTAADELCGGRLVFCHEGGYAAPYVPFCGLAVIETLSGYSSGVEDPFLRGYESLPFQDLQAHQASAVEAAAPDLGKLEEASS